MADSLLRDRVYRRLARGWDSSEAMTLPRQKGNAWIPRVEARPQRRKRCSSCQEWLPIECFHRTPQNADGRRNDCGACRKERRLELKAGAPRLKPWQRRHLASFTRSAEADHDGKVCAS